MGRSATELTWIGAASTALGYATVTGRDNGTEWFFGIMSTSKNGTDALPLETEAGRRPSTSSGDTRVVDHEKDCNQVVGTSNVDGGEERRVRQSVWTRTYGVLSYTPARCRYDPDHPFEFSMGLNVLFGMSGHGFRTGRV